MAAPPRSSHHRPLLHSRYNQYRIPVALLLLSVVCTYPPTTSTAAKSALDASAAMLVAEAGGARWQKITGSDDGSGVQVWIASSTAFNCGGSVNAALTPAVTIAVLEPYNQLGKTSTGAQSSSSPPDINLGEGDKSILCPPANEDPETFGLKAADETWNYRRAFVSCDCGFPCNGTRFLPVSASGKDLPEQQCSRASTHKAWWLGDEPGGWYGIRIPLPNCVPHPKVGESASATCHPHVALFGGIENCTNKLEPLSLVATDQIKDSQGCTYAHSTKKMSPLFAFDLPDNWPTYKQELATLSQPSKPTCNYADQSLGSWQGFPAVWTAPGCDAALSDTLLSLKTDSILSKVKDKALMCTIGDSHFERTVGVSTRIGATEFGVEIHSEGGDSENMFINGSDKRQEILAHNMRDCAGRHKKSKGKKDSIVLSMSSHWTYASPEDLTNFAAKMADRVRNTGECLLVTAALDSCHENIPKKFPEVQRVERNSWRAAAQVSVHLWLCQQTTTSLLVLTVPLTLMRLRMLIATTSL